MNYISYTVIIILFVLQISGCYKNQGVAVSSEKLVDSYIEARPGQIDFGRIGSLSKVTREFELFNVGKDIVLIDRVESGCYCTTANLNNLQILPGHGLIIPVTYNPRYKSGLQSETLTVFWDSLGFDSSLMNQETQVQTIANVIDSLNISNPAVVFEVGRVSNYATEELVISSLSDSAFKVTGIETPSFLDCKIYNNIEKTEYSMLTRLQGVEDLGVGTIRDVIKINTSDILQPVIEIDVIINMLRVLKSEPSKFFIEKSDYVQDIQFSAKISRLDGEAFTISEVSTELIGFTFSYTQNALKQHTVHMNYKYKENKSVNGVIEVYGLKGEEEMVKIPIGIQ